MIGDWYRQHAMDLSGAGTRFAIGDDYGPTSRHVLFEVIVQEAGDLYEGWEAPASVEGDLFDAPLNDPFYGHLGTEDKADIYRLDLKAAGNPSKVDLDIAFSDVDDACAFLVELHDSEGKRIARFAKLKSKASLELPTAGLDEAYLTIKDRNADLYHLMNSYRLELQTGD